MVFPKSCLVEPRLYMEEQRPKNKKVEETGPITYQDLLEGYHN